MYENNWYGLDGFVQLKYNFHFNEIFSIQDLKVLRIKHGWKITLINMERLNFLRFNCISKEVPIL